MFAVKDAAGTGEAGALPAPMPQLPRPGQRVRWRNPAHARRLRWDERYSPGPFEVVRVVDRTAAGLGHGIVVRTATGPREINEVWLELVAG